MIYRIDVEITAPVHPTEVTDRVVEAITTIFPGAEVSLEDGQINGVTHSLSHLSELIHRRAILDTARSEFFKQIRADGFSFSLKKQPALMGVVTFMIGEPGELGEIDVDVTVHEPDVETFIDRVVPPTEDGVPITQTTEESR